MYEVWYNWEYAKEHNPSLMGFGYTGGFGHVRRDMIDAVDRGDRQMAADRFWVLIAQSKHEIRKDYENDFGNEGDSEGFWNDSLGYWLSEDSYSSAERHFVRETKEEKKVPWWKSIWENIAFWSTIWFVMIVIMSNGGLT